MNAPAAQPPAVILLQLEKELRHAESLEAFSYTLVNRARVLAPYTQGVLIAVEDDAPRIEAISDIAMIDNNAPFVRWLIGAARTVVEGENKDTPHAIEADDLRPGEQAEWAEWSPPHVYWQPIKAPGGTLLGALWLARDTAWGESERALLDLLADAAGHCWQALRGPRRHRVTRRGRRALLWGLAAALAVAQVVPVPQSVLAPAEVVARRPEVVAAPLDGVIRTVNVLPNETVSEGNVLMRYESSELEGRLSVAEEELSTAQAELMAARQGAFSDPRLKAQIAVLQARADLRRTERDHIKRQMARVDIRAGRAGAAVFRDPADLTGLPVKTGQRLMQIADPNDTELRIELAVADAIALEPGRPVRLFLDKSPLDPISATLIHTSYEAQPTPSNVLSYRLVARFEDDARPRLGLRGTAKISGETVPLFLYLFRRPIAAVRQYVGL